MKNPISPAILATLFLAFALTGIQAAEAVKSKSTPVTRSNISNNKGVSDPKDDDCDGRTDAPDCRKTANKDYATDPYVETTQRDQASGQATGKRQHQPLPPRDAASGQATGRKAKTSEAKNTLNAIDKTTAEATTGTTTEASASNNPPPADNFVYPILPADVTHLKEMPVDDSIRLTPR